MQVKPLTRGRTPRLQGGRSCNDRQTLWAQDVSAHRAEQNSLQHLIEGRDQTYQEHERSLEGSATSAGIAVAATAMSARAMIDDAFILPSIHEWPGSKTFSQRYGFNSNTDIITSNAFHIRPVLSMRFEILETSPDAFSSICQHLFVEPAHNLARRSI